MACGYLSGVRLWTAFGDQKEDDLDRGWKSELARYEFDLTIKCK
jgi:hypothetical protein